MSRNGWIKLHVSTLDNPIWREDRVAWQVFEYLLLRAYEDKTERPGRLSTSRQQIAEACDINSNTVYSALKRLKTAKMVNITSNNKRSLISICNWEKYQSSSTAPSTAPSTTNQQQINSLSKKNKDNIYIPTNDKKTADYKKREFVSANLSNFERRFPDLDVPAEWQRCQDYFDGYGKAGKVKDWSATFRNWLASPYEKKRREGNPSLGIRKVKND